MTNKQKRKIEKSFGFIPTKEDKILFERESDFEKNCWVQINRYLNSSEPIDDSIRMTLEHLRALRMQRNKIREYFNQMK